MHGRRDFRVQVVEEAGTRKAHSPGRGCAFAGHASSRAPARSTLAGSNGSNPAVTPSSTRGIVDRLAQRADVIERQRERDDAADGDQPIRRLQADDAAIGGGCADRAAGVRAERAEAEVGGDGRRGAAGNPPGFRSSAQGLRTGP